jgi:hypothetical protein
MNTEFWLGNLNLGSPRRRWEDNVRMDLTEIRWEGVELDAFGSRWGLMAGS